MAKKGIDEMIEDLEYYIEQCKVQTFSSNKIVVPRDELLHMIREIKVKIPNEIEQCSRIMENRDAIIADARKRADDIISSARDEAQRKVNDSEIMQMATDQARELMKQANDKAKEILNYANEDGDAIRIGALHYTNNVMMDLSEFTARFLEEEQTKYNLLVTSLKDTLQTIETNRAQITSQLNSGAVPKDDVTVTQKEEKEVPKQVSEVERVHMQEKKSNRPGFRVPDITQEESKPEKPIPKAAPVSEDSSAQMTKPAKAKIQEEHLDDELDDLDELYLDEF